jgi:DNA-binding CsgD family transcriptional regulator/N-acetylneuraminic acid mutarotase
MDDAGVPVSEREIEVLRLVATGASNQEIARELIISVNTVKVHLRNIFEKLGVQSRTEATLYAIRQGWIEVDGVEAGVAEPLGAALVAPDTFTSPLQPLAWWQRVYMLAALSLALALVFLPALRRTSQSLAQASPISDRPAPSSASPRAQASRWTPLADMPTPRTRLAVAAYQGQLFAIGGDRETGVSGFVEIYSPETDTWSSGAAKPTPVSNIGAALVGDHVYVPGGCVGLSEATDQLDVYSPADDAWSQAAPLPIPLCAYAIAALEEHIYLFGGWDGQGFVDHVLAYDVKDNTWQQQAPMPAPRGFAAAGVIDGVIYVVGGYDGARESAETYAYDAVSQTWTERAAMGVGRGGLGTAVVGNKLYAIGGGWESYLATSERYDPVSNTWTAFETPVLGEWRNLGVASLSTQVYAVGGWSGGYTGVHEAYQAVFRIILPVAQ